MYCGYTSERRRKTERARERERGRERVGGRLGGELVREEHTTLHVECNTNSIIQDIFDYNDYVYDYNIKLT